MRGSVATSADSSRVIRRPVALPPACATRRCEWPPSRPSASAPWRSASKCTPSAARSRTRSGRLGAQHADRARAAQAAARVDRVAHVQVGRVVVVERGRDPALGPVAGRLRERRARDERDRRALARSRRARRTGPRRPRRRRRRQPAAASGRDLRWPPGGLRYRHERAPLLPVGLVARARDRPPSRGPGPDPRDRGGARAARLARVRAPRRAAPSTSTCWTPCTRARTSTRCAR